MSKEKIIAKHNAIRLKIIQFKENEFKVKDTKYFVKRNTGMMLIQKDKQGVQIKGFFLRNLYFFLRG